MTEEDENPAGRLARRGTYFLATGLGAFFAYFNETFGWIKPPEYPRLSDFWFKPLEAHLRPHLPYLAIVLGAVFLACSAYCFHRRLKLDRARG